MRRADHPIGHVKYPAIRPFLDGQLDSFAWPFAGSSPGSNRYYARMAAGDQAVFWMGDGVQGMWGIIGFGAIRGVDHTNGGCTLERGVRAAHTITPYPSGHPERTAAARFLRDLFGPSYRPLRKLYVRLGYEGVKPCVVTVDEVSQAQFTALALRASSSAADDSLPEEVLAAGPLVEGTMVRVTGNAYERNPEARRQCLAAHGTACCICGFRFGAAYGPEAEGYIHVHHVRPLSEVGGAYVVDPVEDLRPVCPNCHVVLHLGERCRSIEEVRQLRAQQRHAEPDASADRRGT